MSPAGGAAVSPAGRAVLLVAGSCTGRGGAPMRWRALQEAISASARCVVHEIQCDRMARCREECLAGGRPEGTGWYGDRAHCQWYADGLIRDFRAAGVSTVVCSGMDTYRYVPRLALAGGFHVVCDAHNVEAPLFEAIRAAIPDGDPFAPFYQARATALAGTVEEAAFSAAHEVWVCSPDDDRLLRASYPGAAGTPVRVVPNVVFLPPAPPATPPAQTVARVSYTGRMDYYPNVQAARALVDDIAPLLARARCPVPVVIAGARLVHQFRRRQLPSNVKLYSDPDTVSDVIAGSVMAVPLTVGSGSRFKVLEGFALGAPVVSTAKGMEGLAASPGEHYLPAETPAEFAAAILGLVLDRRRRDALTSAAWRLVRDRYSVPALTDTLRGVVCRATGG